MYRESVQPLGGVLPSNFFERTRKIVAKTLIVSMLVLDIPVVPLINYGSSAQAAALLTDPNVWVTVTPKADPLMQNLNIPATAATQGMWSAPFAWPMNGLHNMILPDGKVLTFGTNADGGAQEGRTFDIWDPSLGFGANSHNTSFQAAQQDSFCSTAAYLNDGNMLITGGNAGNGGFGKGSVIYNPVNNSRATAQAVTALPRWYSTMIGLPDGRKLVMGGMAPYTEGMYNDPAGAITRGEPSMTPEIYENGAWRSLLGANSRLAFGPDFLRTSFPHAFVAPNGQVFGISADRMWYLDVNANNGAGAVYDYGQFKPGYGNKADPDNVGALSVAVMYDIGKIIQAGGNGGFNGDGFPSSNKATNIDINGGAPVLTELPRMNIPRRYGNGVVLANGEVVITGGTRFGNDGGDNAVYAAEIWNPVANNWRLGASASTIRVYHSINSLLLNGAIISTGGGTPGPVLNKTGEVYYPPYLFEQVGGASQLAKRPEIRGISGLKYAHGATMQMDMDSTAAITGLSLIALSNGTHSFNNGQRRIPLQFTQEDNRLTATIPNANLTLPGYYQVVALNAQGVPSYANVIAVGAQMAAPQVGTTPYNPGAVTPPPPPPANVPPTVALTAPVAGVAYTQGETVAMTATAADSDGTVAYVDFYDGGTLLGSDTVAPYDFNWVTSAATAVGNHNITAVAVDNAGASTTSAVRGIVINAPAGGGGTGSGALPAGVSSAWSFNEGVGATVADASGNNRPLTLSNATWVAGISGQAAQLNGANASGTVGQALVDTAASFSISAWVKLDNLNGWQTIVNQDGVNISGFWLQFSQYVNGGKFMLTMHDVDATASGALRAVSTTTPIVGQWYHLVGVRDKVAGTMKIYVNGQLEGTTPWAGGWASNGALNVGRGKWGGPNDWVAGAVDGVSVYNRTLTDADVAGLYQSRDTSGAVTPPAAGPAPTASTAIVFEKRTGANNRVWVVNPDNDSVSVLDATTNALIQSIPVGIAPRTIAIAPNGNIWVTNKESATISVISPTTLAVVQTIAMPRASQPFGLAFAPNGSSAFVVLEASGELRKLDPTNGALQATLAVGSNPRHVSVTADSATALVSRFITPSLPGEGTATVDTTTAGAEVLAVNTGAMTLNKTIVLRHSDKADTTITGSGIPNYLGAVAISPDGKSAWVPSKQDNIKRGMARNGLPLNFQNTVRAISSRIDMTTLAEDYALRVDHDNSSLGSAALYHPNGTYLFVALETSRQVAIINPTNGVLVGHLDTGLAPQGLAIAPDGSKLFVQNFMSRTVGIYDLAALNGQANVAGVTLQAQPSTVNTEKLPANILAGKQLFYDAKDRRLALDSYMSCASCHNDGGHDGRVWDLTGFGEGLRNTINLKGRAAMGHGNLHWSANFDELQDFEGQIRTLSGGTGLMTDAQFNTGTRNQPLGDKKAGVSADLDNLAAYVTSLNTFAPSPNRNADGTLTAAATAGKAVFANSCASCHGGANFTTSTDGTNLKTIGTINALSGQRLGAALTGLDVPTLRDVWATAPYLHNGSAPTVTAAVQAHNNLTLSATDLANVVAYVQQIGSEEASGGGGNIVPNGVAGSWSFNEGVGATVADASGNNRPLTLSNATWVAGISGQAAQLNGANASGTVGQALVDTAASFSISAWVKLDNLNGWQTIVNQDGVNISGFWLQFSQYVNGGKFMLTMHDVDATASGALRAVSTTTPIVGQWYHLVGVRDKVAGTMKIYVNGQLEGTTPWAGGWASNGALNVGRGKWGGPNDWVAGAVDGVSVYNRTLTDADVAGLYQARGEGGTVTPPPPNALPTVALTAPASGSTITQGATVAITATAADSDGTVARVEFYDGATLLGTDATAPYALDWVTSAATAIGVHSLTARAYDNTGAVNTSAAVDVTVNAPANVAPTVAITAPTLGSTITQGATVAITATAADSDGTVARVEFYDGATLLGTDNAAPYAYSWLTSSATAVGAHSLTALAYDNSGAVTTSAAVGVTINAPANVAPSVALTAPVAGRAITRGATVAITATAADSDGTVARVEFYDGATLLGTDTTAPYAYSWVTSTSTAVGAHSLTARAYDNAGAVTTSAAVGVTVNAPANVAPTVAITAPTSGSTITRGATVTITATAADSDGTVARVEFYDGATLLGTDTTAPYAYSWVTTTSTATGTRSLTARAFDNTGAATTSAAVSLTVNAPMPPANSIRCASQNGTCRIPTGRTATVWFGANSSWAVRTGVSVSISCNTITFGDPIPGTVKSCRYLAN